MDQNQDLGIPPYQLPLQPAFATQRSQVQLHLYQRASGPVPLTLRPLRSQAPNSYRATGREQASELLVRPDQVCPHLCAHEVKVNDPVDLVVSSLHRRVRGQTHALEGLHLEYMIPELCRADGRAQLVLLS